MAPGDFGKWMKEKKLRVNDVAYFTGFHTNTIYSYLRGETKNSSTRQALEQFKVDFENGAYQLNRRKVPAMAG